MGYVDWLASRGAFELVSSIFAVQGVGIILKVVDHVSMAKLVIPNQTRPHDRTVQNQLQLRRLFDSRFDVRELPGCMP